MGLRSSVARQLQFLLCRAGCARGVQSKAGLSLISRLAAEKPRSNAAKGRWWHIFCSSSRRSFSAFQPSRLYPQQSSTPESGVFWGIIASNVLLCLATQQQDPGFRQLLHTQLRSSIAAVLDGHYSSIISGPFLHTSAVHCALNLLVFGLVRRVQPLSAGTLLALYYGGNLAGSLGHLGWYWYDAGGFQYGDKYARNTPGLYGCSGGVAAVAAYKLVLDPGAMQVVGGFLPVPILLVTALYCMLEVVEPGYSDGPSAKCGGAALGVLVALLGLATGRCVPAWRAAAAAAAKR